MASGLLLSTQKKRRRFVLQSDGLLFPTTRSIKWSRPMVALTSALRDRWVRTRALYSVSFCLRRADGSMGACGQCVRSKSHVNSGVMIHAHDCTSDCLGGRADFAGDRPEG